MMPKTITPDGAVVSVPEQVEAPPENTRDVCSAMLEQNAHEKNPPREDLTWRLTLVDWDFVGASPGQSFTGAPTAEQLAERVPETHAIGERWRTAVAQTRGAWGDPKLIAERIVGLERSTVDALVAHYRATRQAAQAFGQAARPPRLTPDDALALDMADSVVRNFGPEAVLEWFAARYAEGHRSWPSLRQIVDRLARKPPAHLQLPDYQRAFEALANQPFDDPFTTAREAREVAADVVRRVRRIANEFATTAAEAGM